MATVSIRPINITRIAADHDLSRAEVATLIAEHAIPTHQIGSSRVVAPADWPRLERLVKRLVRRKAGAPSP